MGSQQREVLCLRAQSHDRAGHPTCELLHESECKYHPKPETDRQCQAPPCRQGSWYTSEWSPCSHSCGVGAHSRIVACLDKHKELAYDCDDNAKPNALESCGNDICPDYGAQRGSAPSYVTRPDDDDPRRRPAATRRPFDINDKAGTLYTPEAELGDSGRRPPRPFDINDKAGTQLYPPPRYDAQPSLEDQSRRRAPVDLNNKDGTLYDARPENDERRRPPIDLNNKDGTLYDAQPENDDRRYARPPVDLNNKDGTLYDAQPENDDRRYARPPVDLNNKDGTLYDAQPENDDRRYARPPVDLNNKDGTLYNAEPQADDRRYARPPVDLNNKDGTLYDAQPENDDRRYARPPVDLNNKAGTLYDAEPQNDDRRRIDLNNKDGTLYDSQPQRDYRPPIDLNNKDGTLYDAQPQQDYRGPIDLNNKDGTLYDSQPQQDYRPPIDLNNKAGTLYDASRAKGDAGVVGMTTETPRVHHATPESHTVRPPPRSGGQSRRGSGVNGSNRVRPDGLVDIDVTPSRGRNVTPASPPRQSRTTPAPETGGNGGNGQKACVDKIDRCKTVKELAFCRYDYYKKMCCKSCSV